MFEFIMLIMGFTGLAYFGQKFKNEQEMQKGWRNSKESRYLLTCCLRQLEEYMPE